MTTYYKKYVLILIILLQVLILSAQKATTNRTKYFPREEIKAIDIPDKSKVWVFILAGQSNMAGRGLVEAQDTVPNNRILTINSNNGVIVAKEPIHFYTPDYKGLGCGLSFAKNLLNNIPEDIYLLLLPTAVGGSSINKWIKDIPHRNVPLYSNFKEKVALGKQYGTIKAVLWHQGEADANKNGILKRQDNLKNLFNSFRDDVENNQLPILIGELGAFSKEPDLWHQINKENRKYARKDKYAVIIKAEDLEEKGDRVHFNSTAQRELGKRYAQKYIRCFSK
ncbi:sialate O-acetylesterase [Plebeiibacterium marinum]|uniref:Sialate O-acetylesterase n=1 Tax=Plebeiibacterium marinum TaxID=2992111 RepID=A0AAE3SL65_9BACT|nr:sialate O-acetylesterase [Plebeiobacterium marinum]MCW3807114.1 sialate O-acetylesterase [Plebeiobacterium marinum]